jgi:hypothetical protein
MQTPTPTEIAILKTMLYAEIFEYPLTEREIHHYLIGQPAALDEVSQRLQHSEWLGQHLTRVNGYYALQPHQADLRHQRDQISQALWHQAEHYGRLFAYLPFVRMVALTGALAMRNANSPQDDLDYFIITVAGRVWLTRLLAVILVRLARLWGVELCPNYILAESKLTQERQDLYIAHELTQMFPISGHILYEQIRAANPWTKTWMPNADGPFYTVDRYEPHGWGLRLQRWSEWLLGGRLGDWIEAWEGGRKTRKFAQEAARHAEPSAAIDHERVKGHFNDYGHPVLRRYAQLLRDHDLE